jgi:hypothetical protein
MLSRTTNNHASIGMSDQHNIIKIVHLQHAHNIGDMSCKIDGRIDQMCTISQARERYGEHAMTPSLKKWHKPIPAPAAMPCTMDQNEGGKNPTRALHVRSTSVSGLCAASHRYRSIPG